MDKITSTYIETNDGKYHSVSVHRDGKLIEHEISYTINMNVLVHKETA